MPSCAYTAFHNIPLCPSTTAHKDEDACRYASLHEALTSKYAFLTWLKTSQLGSSVIAATRDWIVDELRERVRDMGMGMGEEEVVGVFCRLVDEGVDLEKCRDASLMDPNLIDEDVDEKKDVKQCRSPSSRTSSPLLMNTSLRSPSPFSLVDMSFFDDDLDKNNGKKEGYQSPSDTPSFSPPPKDPRSFRWAAPSRHLDKRPWFANGQFQPHVYRGTKRKRQSDCYRPIPQNRIRSKPQADCYRPTNTDFISPPKTARTVIEHHEAYLAECRYKRRRSLEWEVDCYRPYRINNDTDTNNTSHQMRYQNRNRSASTSHSVLGEYIGEYVNELRDLAQEDDFDVKSRDE